MRELQPFTDSSRSEAGGSKAAGLLVQLGLRPSNAPSDTEALDRRIAAFAPLWPIVVLVSTLCAAPQFHWMIDEGIGQIMLAGMAILAISPFAIFYVPRIRRVRPHWRMLALTGVSSLAGVGCARLAMAVAAAGPSGAGLLFICSAGFVIMAALARLPVTMLAFSTALIATVLVLIESTLALAILAPIQLCATLVAIAAARADFSHARSLWRAELEASRPARLLDELEKSGSAWFWETDRRGKLLYLSARIAEMLGETLVAGGGRLRPPANGPSRSSCRRKPPLPTCQSMPPRTRSAGGRFPDARSMTSSTSCAGSSGPARI